MTRRTPLALFVYNRPGHTRRALEAISALERLEDVDLIVFCDAPKQDSHAAAVDEARGVVRDHARTHRLQIVERAENLGLARSIAGSVTELVGTHGQAVVLEDDLVPAPDFLAFMLDGLERYRDAPSVMQISGCLLPGTVAAPAEGLFLPLTTTWGWATWDRAWTAYGPVTPEDRAALDQDAALRHRFTAEGRVDYVAMLDHRLQGRNDSWGILWWYAVAKARGLVLYPNVSLIWNGGFDASGVHCGGTETFQPRGPEAFYQPRLARPIRLPDVMATDPAAWAAVLAFLAGPAPEAATPRSFARRLAGAARRVLGLGLG